ncbi:MAG TPA: flagellin lysine-N-methylase [Polyangia bacterium]|nr:flagellin lysine-N-methylase [Polyangia bacterium]
MPESFLAARYMTRFQCTGSACEDTCCHVADRAVALSQADYRRLESAMLDGDDRETFARAFRPTAERRSEAFAVIRPRDDGACVMLDADRLCAVQRRFGEALLPDACSAYPRAVAQLGEQLELTGRLSCPEVARLCLLAGDAVEPVPIAREAVGRGPIARTLEPPAEEDPWVELFEPVRQVLVGLSGLERFPVASRQFFIGALGERVGSFLHRGAAPFEPPRIVAELREMSRAETQRALHAQLTAAPPRDEPALAAVFELVRARLAQPVAPAFRRVVAAAAGASSVEDPLAPLDALGPAAAAEAHARRRADVSHELNARLERWFGNYCRDFWIHDWYLASPSILEHALGLGLRLALLRFLLLAQPALAAAGALGEEAARGAAYDRVAVEVFYAVTRAFEHDEPVRASLGRALAAHGPATLDRLQALLAV